MEPWEEACGACLNLVQPIGLDSGPMAEPTSPYRISVIIPSMIREVSSVFHFVDVMKILE